MTCQDSTGVSYRVRELASADREALERFYAQFEPKRAAQGLPPEGAHRIQRWLDGVLRGGTHIAIESDVGLVGHALIIPMDAPGSAEYAIFLDHAIRGRGLGTAVNRVAATVARERGHRRLWLSVEPHNRAAIRSYERAGFRFHPATLYSAEPEMELRLEE